MSKEKDIVGPGDLARAVVERLAERGDEERAGLAAALGAATPSGSAVAEAVERCEPAILAAVANKVLVDLYVADADGRIRVVRPTEATPEGRPEFDPSPALQAFLAAMVRSEESGGVYPTTLDTAFGSLVHMPLDQLTSLNPSIAVLGAGKEALELELAALIERLGGNFVIEGRLSDTAPGS